MAEKMVLRWPVKVGEIAEMGSGPVLYTAVRDVPDTVQVWTEETDPPLTNRRVMVYGTGEPIPEQAQWIGTTQWMGKTHVLVWHLYDVTGVGRE